MWVRLLDVLVIVTLLVLVACSDDGSSSATDAGNDGTDARVGLDLAPDVADTGDIGADPMVDVAQDPTVEVSRDATAEVEHDAGNDLSEEEDGLLDVQFVVTVPNTTPDGAPVYIAGNFQDWEPGHADYQLTEAEDGTHRITLGFEPDNALQFKFTRGNWETVEKGPSGEELPNRELTVTEAGVETATVDSWADLPTGPSTITGDVRAVEVPGFLDGRRVWIYLPPGYDETSDRYPVLYMLDGQNMFDQRTSFAGEWRVDETCEALIGDGDMAPIIVVAVANGGGLRFDEYTPWFDEVRGVGGAADAHLDALVDTLIPYVDANYRTLTGREDRGLGGSSLAGLFPLYAAFAASDTFGRIAALSPSLQWDDEHYVEYVAEQSKPATVIYSDMGTRELGVLVDDDDNGVDDFIDRLRAVKAALITLGFVEGTDLTVVEDDGATHSEAFWAARMPDALRFLFPPSD